MITVNELKKLKKEDYILVDVREAEELKAGSISGNKNIPSKKCAELITKRWFPNDKKVIVYCEHGIRSGNIEEFAKAHGYKNFHSIKGGYAEYKNS
ncbi:MAG TPA: rhodanese-like domain-containing protein [Candidatus Nanoarchaeia archaeon]|nr:rhodanese-like domain-containing protein [Candidatus Nanoarchaeia archaeon]